MGAGRILGAGSRWAGALLVTLTVLRPHLAHCTEPPGEQRPQSQSLICNERGARAQEMAVLARRAAVPVVPPALSSEPREHFLYQAKCDCLFTNGTERVRFLERYIWDRQQIAHFDSDVGRFVADTELGRRSAEHWNGDQEIVAEKRAAADTFCRYNYPVGRGQSRTGECGVPPKVKVSPTQSGSQPHSHQLVCSVTGFYPGGIEIKWLKNGQEQTAGVVSTELLHNGDWTFQILLMLEMSPRRGDVYTCQVEHVSLRDPITVHWEAQSDSARSKMLTGVGGFVLGLIFLAPGLLIYLKNKKGHPVPQPAGNFNPPPPVKPTSPYTEHRLPGAPVRQLLLPLGP
uniref:Ig-like domain-containing protein n=1 Tax=Chelydra serpentina TaxID=8475 RepID=A0A8C3S4S7_CHESE